MTSISSKSSDVEAIGDLETSVNIQLLLRVFYKNTNMLALKLGCLVLKDLNIEYPSSHSAATETTETDAPTSNIFSSPIFSSFKFNYITISIYIFGR